MNTSCYKLHKSLIRMPISRIAGRFIHSTKVIAVVDVVESVRLMELDAHEFIDRWHGFVSFVQQHVPPESGRMHKSLGDGLMLEFSEAQGCIRAAMAMQAWFAQGNAERAPEQHVHLRIGAHLADFVADEYDIYGPDVNLAARVASLAGPGEIVITQALRDRLEDPLPQSLEDLGICHLKHVKDPVRAYRIGPAGSAPVVPVQSGPAQALRPRVAVLPFASYDLEVTDATGEALADDIVSGLARSDLLQVASRMSTASLGRPDTTIDQVQRQVGVGYVLSGRLRRNGPKLSLYAELADAHTEQVVWAHSFHGDRAEIGTPRGALRAHVVGALHAEVIRHEVERSRGRGLHALGGATLLLGSIGLMHRLALPDLEHARAMLEHLSERWRRHAAAHAWLAQLHVLRIQQGMGAMPLGDDTLARAHAASAVQSDPGSALALGMHGWVLLHVHGQMDEAHERYAQALLAQDGHPLVLLHQAELAALRGRGAEARALGELARAVSPLEPLLYLHDHVQALAALAAGDAAAAAASARQSLRRNPRYVLAHCALAAAQVEMGDVGEAKRTVQRLLAQQPAFKVAAFVASVPPAATLVPRIGDALLQARAPAA
jgi:adenylate cyclase